MKYFFSKITLILFIEASYKFHSKDDSTTFIYPISSDINFTR